MQGQLQKAAQEWASLITNLPLKKWWRAAPRWLSVLMVILVAKSASDLTWIIFAPDEKGGAVNQSRQVNSQSPGAAGSQPRLQTVADLHLFGVASKAPVVLDAPIEATETKLKLILRGVFAATDPQNAMAIIADARGEEKVYKKSETIFSGVKLYEIYSDKVILERGGSFETLSLPKDEESTSSRPAFVSSRTARPTTRMPTDEVTRTREIHAGNKLDQLKQKLTTEPTEFWKEVRIEPVQDENSQIKGYRFNHNDPQIMRALGLRPGDVILEVNGSPVSDPSVLTSLLSDLGSQSTLSLGIERNGQRENLNIQM